MRSRRRRAPMPNSHPECTWLRSGNGMRKHWLQRYTLCLIDESGLENRHARTDIFARATTVWTRITLQLWTIRLKIMTLEICVLFDYTADKSNGIRWIVIWFFTVNIDRRLFSRAHARAEKKRQHVKFSDLFIFNILNWTLEGVFCKKKRFSQLNWDG